MITSNVGSEFATQIERFSRHVWIHFDIRIHQLRFLFQAIKVPFAQDVYRCSRICHYADGRVHNPNLFVSGFHGTCGLEQVFEVEILFDGFTPETNRRRALNYLPLYLQLGIGEFTFACQ